MEPHVGEGGRSSQTEGAKVYETPVPEDSAAGWATLKWKDQKGVSIFPIAEYSCHLPFVPFFFSAFLQRYMSLRLSSISSPC